VPQTTVSSKGITYAEFRVRIPLRASGRTLREQLDIARSQLLTRLMIKRSWLVLEVAKVVFAPAEPRAPEDNDTNEDTEPNDGNKGSTA
jgi:hypothetical protein